MKLKKGILLRKTAEGTTVVVPDIGAAFSGTMSVNETAALIISCLKRNTSENAILTKMKRKFSGDPDAMLADIESVINNLKEKGLIDE